MLPKRQVSRQTPSVSIRPITMLRQAVRCCNCSITLWQEGLERGITGRSLNESLAFEHLRRLISHRTMTVKD